MVPTIGRIVWYYPSDDFDDIVCGSSAGDYIGAMVQGVSNSGLVLVAGVDCQGQPFAFDDVPLYAPDEVPEEYKETGGYATWMPYQVAQAAKESGK